MGNETHLQQKLREKKQMITGLQERISRDSARIHELENQLREGFAYYERRDKETIAALEKRVRTQRKIINSLQDALERRYK